MGTLALISLGSNLGDRKAHLDKAVAELARTPGVQLRRVSSYHETVPVGGPRGQGAFLNAAVALETTLEPVQLHARLREAEAAAGRVRDVRWGERTLDLDLLLFGDSVLRTPDLLVPHPRMAVRRFVLAPAAEVAPQVVEPLTRRTVADLLANLDRRPSYLVLVGPDNDAFFRRLVRELRAVGLYDGTASGHSYWNESDPLNEPDFDAILQQKTRELSADRWSPEIWGDRWILTDFWFDLIHGDAVHWRGEAAEWKQRFLDARRQVIQPTFVVATSAWSYSQLRRRADRNRGPDSIGAEVPLLWPGQCDPEATAAAIESGAAPLDARRNDRETEAMIDEIRSACEASRCGGVSR